MTLNTELFDFIKNSPSAFHTVNTVKNILIENGYTELPDTEDCELSDGGKYFALKGGSSIIAFRYKSSAESFMLVATHSDSPSFKLKPSCEKGGKYAVCDTEKYGGMIHYTWLDRPLSLAGRAVLKTERGIETRLVNIDRDLLVIPSVAIHLNRNVNSGAELNPAVDLLPLSAMGEGRGKLFSLIAESAGAKEDELVSHDLFLYVRDEGRIFGTSEEFILAPRLDDLACVFASLKAFLSAEDTESIPVLAVFDNEEVGSQTKEGADSPFLDEILALAGNKKYRKMLEKSLMVSADNGHASHPNHPELSDAENAPLLNGGVVIKHNANQRYATDAVSEALFLEICKSAASKVQRYSNRADIPGGSTLGSIASTRVPIMTVDIGLPQLAMHSAVETAGAYDLYEMVKALTELYSSYIDKDGAIFKILK